MKRYDEDGKEITSLKVHGKKIRKPYTLKSTIAGYLCISAFLILYLVFTIWPLIDGFLISFTEWNILGPRVFVGLSNYIEMLQSELFWSSLWHTTIFVLLSVPAIMIGGFLLALLVDHKNLKCNTFFRVTFFSPQVLSVAIVSYIWVVVLEPYTGLLNNFLGTVGIMGDEIFWLRDRSLVWFSLVMITFWWTVGFNMILYLAAMQDIPDSYYESAEIDGASYFQKTRYITIPYLKRTHILLLFLQLVASFRVFGQVFLVTGGGPAGATRTYIQYIFETAFQRFLLGPGSAASIILFLIILLVSLFQLRILKASPD